MAPRRRPVLPPLSAQVAQFGGGMNTNPIIIAPPPPGINPRRSGGFSGLRLTGDPTNPGTVGDLGGGFSGGGNEDSILGGILRDLGKRAGEELGNRLFGGGGGTSGDSGSSGFAAGCPTGFKRNADGQCIEEGLGGAARRILPGGGTGTLEGMGGTAVMGAFGKPAVIPMQVGTRTRNDGVVSPILQCPRSMVLGTDNLCYPKSSISRADRKWKPSARPPVSAHDAKMMRKYGPGGSKQNSIKKLATSAGFSCRKR